MKLLLLFLISATAATSIRTKYGDVVGLEVTGKEGNLAEIFLGIPFAKAPVGELRFEKPQPPSKWGTLNATKFGKACVPHGRNAGWNYDEDCLFLNVIRPKNAKNLPVLVWIHGGGFEIGSAAQHGYQAFVDNYLKDDVIVVSIQYRLGFLGFFTDGTEKAPGNMGMFDQTAALKFIKENIENFGGDSNDVTVWGYSAGAASVSLLSVSPYSRDLFQKSIIMSASSLVQWATGQTSPNNSVHFAEAAGCTGNDRKTCLKGKTIEQLHEAMDQIGLTSDNIDFLLFTPFIDGDFLPKNPYYLIEESPRKPTLIGLSNKEFLFFAGLNHGKNIQSMGLTVEQLKKIDTEYFRKVIYEKILYSNQFGEKKAQVAEKLMEFYTMNKPEGVDQNDYLVDSYSKIFSDIVFNVPINREIRRRFEVGTDIWTYKFNYANEIIFPEGFPKFARGSPHANEYHYLFDMPLLGKMDLTQGGDKTVKDALINSILTFVKHGTPKIAGLDWNKVTSSENVEHLEIDTNLSFKNGIFDEETKFYEDLAKYGFDLIDPTLKPEKLKEEL